MCVVCEQVYVDLVRPEFSLNQSRCFAMHRLHIFNTSLLKLLPECQNIILGMNISAEHNQKIFTTEDTKNPESVIWV